MSRLMTAIWPNSDLSGMSAGWSLCGKADVEQAARHPRFMRTRPNSLSVTPRPPIGDEALERPQSRHGADTTSAP